MAWWLTMCHIFVKCADWPKLHDIFKARRYNQGTQTSCCHLCPLFVIHQHLFYDVVARAESRCVIKAKHTLPMSEFFLVTLEKLILCESTRTIFIAPFQRTNTSSGYRTGDKPSITQFTDAYMYHRASPLRLTHWGRDKMAATLADDTFKRRFANEDILISIKISLKFVSKGPINNMPALV